MGKLEQQMLRAAGLEPSKVQRETFTNQYDVIRINFTSDGLDSAEHHLDELEAIRSAGEEDVIVCYFTDCVGGVVGTGMSLINALMLTPAHTIAILEGHNASMATMIPLACKEVVVTPYTSMMLHSATGGSIGTMANLERHSIFFNKMFTEFMKDIYEGFVREGELEDLCKGMEVYLDSDQIQERLEERKEYLSAQEKESSEINQELEEKDL